MLGRWDGKKTTLGITGFHETLGRDYGIEERYRGPSNLNYAQDAWFTESVMRNSRNVVSR